MFSKLFYLLQSLLLSLLLQNVRPALGDLCPYDNEQKFEKGEYGSYPQQRFRTSRLVAPVVNKLSTHPSCDDGSYTMINPRGNSVPEEGSGPMMLDANGNMVWALTGYQQTYNLQVQEYRGKQYLTFWSGNDAVGGHGNGEYIMLDQSYKEIARVQAANGLEADLHEFRITNEGTAVITVYDVREIDLTRVGGFLKGYIWDSVFQEIDLQTGKASFQWRASQHYDILDSYHDKGNKGNRGNPWDFFHINSVEKDPCGNYLISARYTSTISYVNGTSGQVIWTLGGKANQFTDLSGGRATDFKYQHDARWHDNYTTITIFNNGAQAPFQEENSKFSSGRKIRIDTEAMTAELVTEFVDSREISSSSQGNMQVLPNGNHVVGYGYNGAAVEYSSTGEPLCETHFEALDRFHSGDVQSYRVMKFNWTGLPNTDPALALVNNTVYVSWNGATEVDRWMLEVGETTTALGYEDISWEIVSKTKKAGFETAINLPEDSGTFLRIVAYSKTGYALGITETVRLDQQVRSHPI
ncbi:hypothetical protein K491DRAFT_744930 [Lophiostoma macrostomum CBS 122681]|uniref:Arylsulfotransferase n=1 Tax=Lophiostoma macrostomum CBS 122681 TaxID=1314788 RepID=A0A6A6TSA2_9PLEO|nr:hypothetical protein K491DRAFT_744930 [Lophiostoma macrostomum CBS 122681]